MSFRGGFAVSGFSVVVCCGAGKILVDVSNNRRVNQYPESNAEYLASLLPDSIVVKGFNVLSSWAMQQPHANDTSTQVPAPTLFYSVLLCFYPIVSFTQFSILNKAF